MHQNRIHLLPSILAVAFLNIITENFIVPKVKAHADTLLDIKTQEKTKERGIKGAGLLAAFWLLVRRLSPSSFSLCYYFWHILTRSHTGLDNGVWQWSGFLPQAGCEHSRGKEGNRGKVSQGSHKIVGLALSLFLSMSERIQVEETWLVMTCGRKKLVISKKKEKKEKKEEISIRNNIKYYLCMKWKINNLINQQWNKTNITKMNETTDDRK